MTSFPAPNIVSGYEAHEAVLRLRDWSAHFDRKTLKQQYFSYLGQTLRSYPSTPKQARNRKAARAVRDPLPDNALLTVEDVAARLRLSPKQVRKLVNAGRLRYVDVGLGSKHRAMRFTATDVSEYVESLTKRNSPTPPTCSAPPTQKRRRTMNSEAEIIGFTARRLAKQKQKAD